MGFPEVIMPCEYNPLYPALRDDAYSLHWSHLMLCPASIFLILCHNLSSERSLCEIIEFLHIQTSFMYSWEATECNTFIYRLHLCCSNWSGDSSAMCLFLHLIPVCVCNTQGHKKLIWDCDIYNKIYWCSLYLNKYHFKVIFQHLSTLFSVEGMWCNEKAHPSIVNFPVASSIGSTIGQPDSI